MRAVVSQALWALASLLPGAANAQEYVGVPVPNKLPNVPGSEITYWKIIDYNRPDANLTLINYINLGSSGQRLVPSKLERAIIFIHGLQRDPGTYESNMLSALSQVQGHPEVNTDTVAIIAPYFPNGDDKNFGYPFTDGLAPGRGSNSTCLVWKGSQWAGGGNNQYPYQTTHESSFEVLDQMLLHLDNKTIYPNIKQLVVGGHSLGGQTVQRYAAVGKDLNLTTPVTYWVANPNSFVWFSTDRPMSTASCPIYDVYREGYTNYTEYPMSYQVDLVESGRPNILANFNGKAIAYARGTQDLGDDSSDCAPFTTGGNRNERFFNFIKAFPPSCSDPSGNDCDTVDFIDVGHDGGAMMASSAGQARLFLDNWSGNGSRAYDFGYPRQQVGDNPYPNPALGSGIVVIDPGTFAGNMTYQGCWTDQAPRSLSNMTYSSNSNTIEMCTAACVSGGNTIAAVEDGTQCFCGTSLSYLASEVIGSSCGSACAGNASEFCGGLSRLSVFSNGAPKVDEAPVSPATVGEFSYLGCYSEVSSGRALGGPSESDNSMTLEECAKFCNGYEYFGAEYSTQCFCANSITSGSNESPAGNCSMTCGGNSTEFCGGSDFLSVYRNPQAGGSVSSSSSVAPPSSSGASPPSTSTGGAASPTGTAASCPGSNGQTVVSNGKSFVVECNVDHSGGDLTSTSVNSFQACIDACAQNAQCFDVSLSGSACYLKSSLGPAVNDTGIFGARLITNSSPLTSSSGSSSTSTSASVAPVSSGASCPGSNGQTVVSNGESFVVECNVDHSGGDLTWTTVNSFQACIDACAQNPQCVDVSLSGSACYLKSSLGPALNASGIYGARLVTQTASPTTSASLSSSTSAAAR